MQEMSFHIRGLAPLVVHNARLSDPLNEWTIALAKLTSKRKKTEEDLRDIAKTEWFGGLYMDDLGPIIPCANIERMLRDAAAKSKMGKQVQAGCLVLKDASIIYEGSKDPEAMWASKKFFLRASCKIGQQRVIRTRPSWDSWELRFTVQFDENLLDSRQVQGFVELAGQIIGIGDWRPKHGRFEVIST